MSLPSDPFPILWAEDLPTAVDAVRPRWLWQGYVAAGNVTLLTGQWKIGKTTLLAALLHALKAGGTVGGRTVLPGRAVVVSEEGPEDWLRRGERFDLAGHVGLLCRPFKAKPTAAQWQGLVSRLARLRAEERVDLVVLDPLAALLPGRDENSAGAMLEALLPLVGLKEAGLAVLVLHHPRKRDGADGQMARGSGALSGFVDVLLEMRWHSGAASADRRRVLRGWSRHEETPRRWLMELDESGTVYHGRGEEEQADWEDGWPVLEAVLEAVDGTLSRQQILERWPTAVPSPEASTLWKWLRRGVELGRLTRYGDGHKGDPFRYGLAGRSSSLLPPLPELAPLENEVPRDGRSLKRAAKALAALEEMRRREAERDANRGEGHD